MADGVPRARGAPRRRRLEVGSSVRRRIRANPSRLVAFMKLMLPAIALAIIALLFAWPGLLPETARMRLGDTVAGGNVSGLAMENPSYVGTDQHGRPYQIAAARASKYSDSASLVHLVRPVADFQASAGETGWIRIVADAGAYNTTEHVIDLAGGITLVDGLNRQFHTDAMRVDLRSGTLTSDRQVRGGLPDGEITSQGIRITDRGKHVAFTGKTRATFRSVRRAAGQ